jgi:hypothetical protein
MKATTAAVTGTVVEVRIDGFSWRATVRHLGTGGADCERFNGRWVRVGYDRIPDAVYRKLRAEVRAAVSRA